MGFARLIFYLKELFVNVCRIKCIFMKRQIAVSDLGFYCFLFGEIKTW